MKFLLSSMIALVLPLAASAQNITRPNIQGPAGIQVNSYSGNMYLKRQDFLIPGRGFALDFTFSYNSNKTALNHGYGNGWTFGYNLLYEHTGSSLIIRHSDGRRDVFSNTGNGFDAPTGIFDILEEYQPRKFRLRTKNGTQFYFDDSTHKRLTRIEDPRGNTLSLRYSGGLPTSIIGSSGCNVHMMFENGLLKQLADSNVVPPRNEYYGYDEQRNLISVVNARGDTMHYDYDVYRNIVRIIDRRGNPFTIRYSSGRKVDSISSPLNSISIDYNTVAAKTTVREAVGVSTQTTSYTFDDSGNVIQKSGNCCGYNIGYEYDADRNITKFTDANGSITLYRYDDRGNLLVETNALGDSIRYTYDSVFNQMISRTDSKGHTSTFVHDSSGNMLSIARPLSFTETWTYDSLGNPNSFTDARGNVTAYTYDRHGNRVSIAYPIGTEYFAFDAVGNLTLSVSANGDSTLYEYDALNQLTVLTDALANTTTYTYDANGNRSSITDPEGNTTNFSYDALDRLVQVSAPLGTVSNFTYDERGNRIAMQDPNRNISTYTYDSRNLLIIETNPLGNKRTFTYDNAGRRLTETDYRGNTSHYAYDSLGRLNVRTDALGNETSYTYDANGNLLSLIDPRGYTTRYLYDSLDRQTAVINPLADTTRFSYDLNGNRIAVRDANGNTTRFSYDANNRLDTIRAPLSSVRTFAYDANANRIQETDPNGNTTHYVFDALNRVRTEITATQDTSTYSYDANGNMISVAMPNGNTVNYSYDALDRVTRIVDLLDTIAAYTYDANGNRLTEKDGNGYTTAYTYDSLDRIRTIMDAREKSMHLHYDANSNLIRLQDRNGIASHYTYDALNRRDTVIDAMQYRIVSTFDAAGNLASISDANGNTTAYTYDALNRLNIETYADSSSKQYVYDGVGNLIRRIDNKGGTTLYSYDALNRLILRNYPDDNDDEFSYDAAGRITGAENKHALIHFAYDAADRLVAEILNGDTTAFAHSTAGRTRTVYYPGGREIVEHRDIRERLDSIHEGSTTIARYTYDAGDRVVLRSYPANNTSSSFTYDSNNHISSITHNPGGFAGFSYAHDNVGNRLYEEKAHRTTHSEQYAYDSLYRATVFKSGELLGGSIDSALTKIQYYYDGVNNRTGIEIDSLITNYTANNMNAYTAVLGADTTNPKHDANGNMTFDGIYTYRFNHDNRLVNVDSGTTAAYCYDPFGRRIHKIAGEDTTSYSYDGARVLEELNNSGLTLASYVYGSWIDDVLHMQRDGEDYFYHHNALGSVVAVSDKAGSVIERYEYVGIGKVHIYDPHYTRLSTSSIGNPYLFHGRRYDEETHNYYYRARYFYPEQGRFTSRDPAGIWFDKGARGNGYSAFGESSSNNLDPYGLLWWNPRDGDFILYRAIKATVKTTKFVWQATLGMGMTVSSGDYFYTSKMKLKEASTNSDIYSPCDAIIYVNGIWTAESNAQSVTESLANEYPGVNYYTFWNPGNETGTLYGIGDLTSSVFGSLGGISITSVKLANELESLYQQMLDDCPCPYISRIFFYAHSQGSNILNSALQIVDEDVRNAVTQVQTAGAQTPIPGAHNMWNTWDPIPLVSNLVSPWNYSEYNYWTPGGHSDIHFDKFENLNYFHTPLVLTSR